MKKSLETRVFFSLSSRNKKRKKRKSSSFTKQRERESCVLNATKRFRAKERDGNDDFTKLKRVVRDDDAHRELHPPQPVGVEIAIHLVREKGVVFVVDLFFSRAQSARERRVVERPRDDGRSRWRHRRERSDRR